MLEVITIANCQTSWRSAEARSHRKTNYLLTIYISFYFALPADPVHNGGFLVILRVGHGQGCRENSEAPGKRER